VEIQDKITSIRNTFNRDELFIKIQRDFDINELLNPEEEFYSKLSFEDYYKTKEAANLLGIPDKHQQILNHLNNANLADYIGATQSTDRRYRFTWQPLFKLKMLFYLFERNFKPNDVAILLGSTAVYVNPEEVKQNRNDSNEDIKQDLINFEKHNQQLLTQMFKTITERSQIQIEQAKAESRMEFILQQLEDLVDVEKHYEILLGILEESEKVEPIKLKSIFKWMQTSEQKTDYNKQKTDINVQLNEIKTKRIKLEEKLSQTKEIIKICNNKIDLIETKN